MRGPPQWSFGEVRRVPNSLPVNRDGREGAIGSRRAQHEVLRFGDLPPRLDWFYSRVHATCARPGERDEQTAPENRPIHASETGLGALFPSSLFLLTVPQHTTPHRAKPADSSAC